MSTIPPEPPDPTWGACSFCSLAVPPSAEKCPICGAPDPIRASEMPSVSRLQRRRLRASGAFRSLIVIAVALGLAYTMISLVVAGPPVVADPLTTSGFYTLGPGNYTILSGEITGGDFVIGNFSTSDPVGLNLVLDVYNSTEMPQFLNGLSPLPQYTLGPSPTGRIVFSAPYTDEFYLIFTNPYPSGSHLGYVAQISTTYESNVGDEGFA
ncbi:MAG TPA: hypothetical protein VN842_03460 [Thermoplasmata archaeon]|nr:hypothetical protein [Thermoplasmata archaeon]